MKFNNQQSLSLLIAFFAFSAIGNAQIKQTHAEQLSLDGISLSAKIYLQGALIGVPDGETLMRDDLRTKGYLPVQEPYSVHQAFEHTAPGGGEVVADPSVFEVEGENAIVDWVFIDLGDADDITKVLHTRSALLQRDGDIVDVDGASPVFFEGVPQGEYYVAIYHRNHLGAMTESPIQFGGGINSVDFSLSNNDIYGDHPQTIQNGIYALRGGDVNRDGRVVFGGPDSDTFELFLEVYNAPGNMNNLSNFVAYGYFNGDVDLNGEVLYSGPFNDKKQIGLIWNKASAFFCGDNVSNCVVLEYIPR